MSSSGNETNEFWRAVKQHRKLTRHARCYKWIKIYGYGFLETTKGEEVFVHKSQLLDAGLGFLHVGSLVQFQIGEDNQGRVCATEVNLKMHVRCHQCFGGAHFARDCVSRQKNRH